MFADAQLAERLDRVNRLFYRAAADAYARLRPGEGPAVLEREHTAALFAGHGSPLTQAGGRFEADDLTALADFYRGRTDGYEAIVIPVGGHEQLERVLATGATVMQWENLLFQELANLPDQPVSLFEVLEVGSDGFEEWESVARRAFWPDPDDPVAVELGKLLQGMPSRRYIARADSKPAGAASMSVYDGVAFLGGAGTLPEFRGKGVQTALIHRRLHDASREADLALVGTSPGSSSQRNAERCGFRVAWTQLSLRVPVG